LNFWTLFRIVCNCNSRAPGHGLSFATGS
jgi:hypothetical protein